MFDAEDFEALIYWLVRGVAIVTGFLLTAVSLGVSWRVFDLVRG